MNLGQRIAQIVEKIGPGPRQRRMPPDENVVVTGFAMKGKDFARRFLQPPPGAIADDRVADLLGHGETHAGRTIVAAGERFHEEKPPTALFTAPDGQELRALQEPFGALSPRLAGGGHRLLPLRR
jgi:hypothetical protein